MSRTYLTAADHVNHFPYDVTCPQSYTEIPAAMLGSGPTRRSTTLAAHGRGYVVTVRDLDLGPVAPIFDNPDPRAWGKAKMPICHLVNMHSLKVPFEVTHDLDVVTILHVLDAYLDEVGLTAQSNSDVKAYVGKVLGLRSVIHRHFRRALARHPDWRAAYLGTDRSGLLRLLQALVADRGDDPFAEHLPAAPPAPGARLSDGRGFADRVLHPTPDGQLTVTYHA